LPPFIIANSPGELVRILVISDIHANLEALNACLAAAPEYDLVFNLGDIIGYGANPNEVVDKSQTLGGLYVRGNHDRASVGLTELKHFNYVAAQAALWTQHELTRENRDWIAALPAGPLGWESLPNVLAVHGAPTDEDEYILSEGQAAEQFNASLGSVTFFGHSHQQGAFEFLPDGSTGVVRPEYDGRDSAGTFEITLEPNRRYLINPGSIGQPRDGDWRAAFAIYDSDSRKLVFYRVPYDVEVAMEKIMDAGLPERLALRLRQGR
jgi:predicted phosphodiesterase